MVYIVNLSFNSSTAISTSRFLPILIVSTIAKNHSRKLLHNYMIFYVTYSVNLFT
jgi:hypothetical protein